MKKNFIVLIVVFCKSIVGFAQNLDAVPNLHKLTADEKERCENMLKQNGITLEKTVYADYIKHDSLWYLDLTLVEAEKI